MNLFFWCTDKIVINNLWGKLFCLFETCYPLLMMITVATNNNSVFLIFDFVFTN